MRQWHEQKRIHKVLLDPSEHHLTVVIPLDGLILAQKLKERLTSGRELRYEPRYII